MSEGRVVLLPCHSAHPWRGLGIDSEVSSPARDLGGASAACSRLSAEKRHRRVVRLQEVRRSWIGSLRQNGLNGNPD